MPAKLTQHVTDLQLPYERFLNFGPENLTEAELLAVILRTGTKDTSALELAEKVIRLTNSKSKLIFKPLPHDDPKQRQPDITLAKEKLGWEPTIELEEGLQYIIEYFKEYRS